MRLSQDTVDRLEERHARIVEANVDTIHAYTFVSGGPRKQGCFDGIDGYLGAVGLDLLSTDLGWLPEVRNRDNLVVNDISRYFPSKEEAEAAFALFDKDDNGDATRDEVEMACLYVSCRQNTISVY